MLYDVDVVVVTEQKFTFRVEADTRTEAKKLAAENGGAVISRTAKSEKETQRVTPVWANEIREPALAAAAD